MLTSAPLRRVTEPEPCRYCGDDAWTADELGAKVRYRRRLGVQPLEIWEAFRPYAEHGTRSKYARGCRCDPCREAARDYQRERRRKLRNEAA